MRVCEKSAHFLGKVRISGGGRCNVTHACFDPRELAARYPRGGRALISAFHRFQVRDTIAWFESRGVRLKTEGDGRMFPVTNSSATIIDCLRCEADRLGVKCLERTGIESVAASGDGFTVRLSGGEVAACDKLLLATGGCRTAQAARPAVSLGHTLEPPVPSLFTFHVETPWLRALPGLAIDPAGVSIPGFGLREEGPLLITHAGLSGPAILRLSAWGARKLHDANYHFPIRINWLPRLSADAVLDELHARRESQPARLVANSPIPPLPARLWENLVEAAGIARETRWTTLSRPGRIALAEVLTRTTLDVTGRSLNKDEFVTCGGIPLREVDFKTMESRISPGLYFAGEILDIDGITGGFNFQAAWTTGWIAGHAMAGVEPRTHP